MGMFNAASMIGLSVAPPILAAMMLVMGWRGMFVTIGVLGMFLAIGWYLTYRDRDNNKLSGEEIHYLQAGSVASRKEPLSFAEWRGLFKQRTMWGMMIGFSGINYTAWLYIAAAGLSAVDLSSGSESTGLLAAIPFLFGAAGMLLNGYVVDALVRRGFDAVKVRKVSIVSGMLLSAAFTTFVTRATDTTSAVTLIGMALFCIHFAGTSCWGLIHANVTARMTASVGSIQNFASFVSPLLRQ